MITVVVDVTERKKRDMMQSRLSNAIDSIPSHVMFWDKDEKLIKVNELARKENASEGIELYALGCVLFPCKFVYFN